jgi:O-antigen/teichoic acid export membrane protein
MERMARPAMWGVVQQYICSGLGIAVLVLGKGLTWYAVTLSCCGFISLIPNLVQLWPELRGHLEIKLRLWKTIAIGGLPFLSAAAIVLVYGSIDILILQAMTDSATVGWYGVAYQWVSLPAFFGVIVVTAFMPQMSRHAEHNPESFPGLANRAIRLVTFAGAPMAAGIALVAAPVLSLLYSADFQHAVPLVQILALHIPLVGIDMVLGSALIAADRQRQWVLVGAAAALLNPALNYVLIPATVHAFSNGAIGAAIATVATEVFVMTGATVLRPSGVLDRPTVSFAVRSGLAALAMVPIVLVLRNAPLAAQIIAGVITYGVACLVLRTVTVDDIRRGARDFGSWGRSRARIQTLETTE